MFNDARKLTTDQQYLLRVRAVDMVFKNGITRRQSAKLLGVSRSHVNKWCQAFELGGYDALKLGRRGRRPLEQMALNPHQCAQIKNIITDNTPDQLKMPFVLWERVAIRELIRSKLGITLALRTLSDYLARWGMTPQRPVERAYQRNPQAVEKWQNEEYTTIRERAQREGATILWGDETGVQNQSNQGRSFAPKGQTPEIRKVGKKLRVNMISTVTNRGKIRFMIYEGKMNQKLFIDFLKRLIASNQGKVFLILDNLSVHHGKIIKEWVSLNHENIELFFIPSYSPELNPDEYLNRDLKKNVNASRSPRNISELKQNLTSFMRKLQKSPARVLKYFNSSWIQYAAT
jgi:transposase